MNQIVLDDALRSKLGDIGQGSEILDETGRLVGYYVPSVKLDPELYRDAVAAISDEEVERRAREPGGRTTAEVMERLERL